MHTQFSKHLPVVCSQLVKEIHIYILQSKEIYSNVLYGTGFMIRITKHVIYYQEQEGKWSNISILLVKHEASKTILNE